MMIIRGFIINTILNVEMSSIGETLLGTTLCKHDDLSSVLFHLTLTSVPLTL